MCWLRALRGRRGLSVRWCMRGAAGRSSRGLALTLQISRLRRRGGRLSDGAGSSADLRAGRARDGRFVHHDFLVLGDVGFAQEGDLDVSDDELAFLQVDAGLVAFEHVEAEEQVDVFAFHDREAAGQEEAADFDLGGMDTAEDLGRADAAGNAGEAFVDKPHDAACLGARGRHDGSLGARVDEGFDFVAVDFDVDVQHVDFTEGCVLV